MRHNAYPKTPQFRNVIKDIRHEAAYMGQDENLQPIFTSTPDYPVVKAVGTVKLHGTNAGISWNRKDGVYTQSRNNAIPVTSGGHFGFPIWVKNRLDFFTQEFERLADIYGVIDETITIFGEWAGEGIQKNVAISEMGKKFFAFEVKVKDFEEDTSYYPGLTYIRESRDIGFYRIDCFPTFEVTIDFANPQASQNEMVEITEQVEAKCPVASAFGVEGIGEGVVYRFEYKGQIHRFKVKGEKHSVTKVKTLAAVDTEKLNSINEFAEYVVTEARVVQAMAEEDARDRRATGDVMRWIANDIISEESDTLEANGLEWKDVARTVSDKARKIFFELLDHMETFPA
jgi:hypothetical protein